MRDKKSFHGGLELKFFPSTDFESLNGVSPTELNTRFGRNLLRLLMMGWNKDWQELILLPFVNAVLFYRDSDFLRQWRLTFQECFWHVFSQLEDKEFTEEQHEQIQLYIANCLSMLPYTDLTPFESIKIPQRIDNQWQMIECAVVPIELSEQKGVRRHLMQDHDRVFAYGLEPIEQPQARSQLIFMGTTYPAGQGFLTQIKSDMKGFETLGHSLYISGRERILQWIARQSGKINVCGVSLGGSLSLQLAIDQGDKLLRVDAQNPAGLHDYVWQKSRYDRWDDLQDKPHVVVQRQGDDPVSIFGVWKKEWDILKVTPPSEKQGPIQYFDHIINYAGFAQTKFTYLDPEAENNHRKSRNWWIYSVGRALIYYPIIWPFVYIFRPIGTAVWQNALPVFLLFLATTLALLAFFNILPALWCIFGSTWLFAAAVDLISDNTQNAEELDCAKLHDPNLLRNPSLDIYHEDNTIELQLSYQELNTYYHVNRCLLKGKELLPMEARSWKYYPSISKRTVLTASQEPENKDKIISFKATKAKVMHIRHTLFWVDRLGLKHDDLPRVLSARLEEYRFGRQ